MASEDQKFNEFCKVLGEYYAFMKNDTYYQSHQGGKFKKVNQCVFHSQETFYAQCFDIIHISMYQLVL